MIELSAQFDGCNRYRMFFTMILPLSKPGLSTLAIYNGVNIWNEFSFKSTEAQYIRLNATKVTVQAGDNNGFGYTIALSEVAVYGAAADGTEVPKTGVSAGSYMILLGVLAAAAGACMILYKKRTI